MDAFRHIGLIGRIDNDSVVENNVVETLKHITQFLLSRDIQIIVEERIADVLPQDHICVNTRRSIGEECDLVIVVGGDGSMLGAARSLVDFDIPVLGVNRGRLGFLTDISPDELETQLGAVLDGEYTVEKRFLLETRVHRESKLIGKATAFNDVVVSSGEVAQMIGFDTHIDGQFVYSQRSDGLIISTPTGSTAYSLSGGGPIMHPQLDAIVMVPMFPHTLTSRPIVIDGNSEIRVTITDDGQSKPVITCDGQMKLHAKSGDQVIIRKKTEHLRLIHPTDHNFYAICRDKLGWSSR